MIIDTHHHLWRFNTDDCGWMDDSMLVLKRDYLPWELGREIKKVGITDTIVVQDIRHGDRSESPIMEI